MHHLKLDHTVRWGPHTARGLAIDGKIAGKFSSGEEWKVPKPWGAK